MRGLPGFAAGLKPRGGLRMTELTEIKAALRRQAFAARKAGFDMQGETGAVDHAVAALLDEIGPAQGQVIAGYMPIRTELDPRPAMSVLAEAAPVSVPVIEAAGRPLRFRAWTPDAVMVDGPFGARVPERGDWLTPTVLIVPLVAFDAAGNRLGYGGGFYDRTLEGLRAARPTRAIGFAFAAQQVDAVPTEPTDQPLDAIVTEAGVIRPRSPLAPPGESA